MRGEEGVGKGDVHPAQEIGIHGGVGAHVTVVVVVTLHATMQSADASAFAIRLRLVAEGDDGEPLRGARKPTEGIVFVAGVLLHTREGGRVQGLEEQRPHTADECGQRSVHGPRG